MIYGYKQDSERTSTMQARMRKNLEKACFNKHEKGYPSLSLSDQF